jgi:hypothetical protein
MTRVPEAIRKLVQERAQRRCEYCRLPDHLTVYGFHADHIIAQQHDGSDELDNLAWACPACNHHKGTNIATYDSETQELTPLYNPRTQIWLDHFELVGFVINGKTSFGRATAKLLQMNHPSQQEARQHLIEADEW